MTTPATFSARVAGGFTVAWQRLYAVLGQASMYRVASGSLLALWVLALALSFTGLIAPTWLELIATLAVLLVACVVSNAIVQRMLRMPVRHESSIITAGILVFVVRPEVSLAGLGGIALAGVVAMVSKYVIAWRGRHILNPAAVGATVLTLTGLGYSAWWVGTPALAVPVILFGFAVLVRTERLRMVLAFLAIAVVTALVRDVVQSTQFGLAPDPWAALSAALWSGPLLFLGAFMLSEPLTLPPRRWQRLSVAAVVGVLAGWPIPLFGVITLGQERALLIGNLVAFAWAARGIVRLRFEGDRMLTPSVRELTFRARRRLRFAAGQYIELEVPHAGADARGTRREFSISSAPADLPAVRIAYRMQPETARESTYKKALLRATPGGDCAATGIWGDFTLPRDTTMPLLLVAAGIGVTPFVSHLREAHARGERRDVVLVYVASSPDELAYRDELAETGVPVVVFTREEPAELPAHWRWAGGTRLDAAGLQASVDDLAARHAFISGPPALIADLAPALERARSLTTDAFAGY